jgi:S-DNA-T family DNA segregation ATPase FtsK/SpoIIIE
VIIQNSSYSEDELYHIAVLTVIETGGASISVLQRKLRIGYDRASKLLERMFKNGIIGPYDGLKPRPILITKEQFLNGKS